jgi:hypothetical protein
MTWVLPLLLLLLLLMQYSGPDMRLCNDKVQCLC